MNTKLPPLKSIYCFESVARLLSFTLAAEELFVTQSAVSHQIKLLEDHLNVKLFRRLTRRLELTAEGKQLYPNIHEAFRLFHHGFDQVKHKEQDNKLTLSLTPALAAKWLVLRLSKFWQAHPEIDLRLHHSIDLVDFERDDVDIAIRWGQGSWPGLDATLLFTGELTPVCSPQLMQGKHPLMSSADLQHHALLHEDSRDDWKQWLLKAGESAVDASKGPIIDDSNALMLAAAHGQGVALGRSALISDDISAGLLINPLPIKIQTSQSYYIVTPKHRRHEANIKALKSFLLAESITTHT